MRKILCILLFVLPVMSFNAFAFRGPSVEPIVEISAEDNSPVPPSEAVPFDFSNSREIASIAPVSNQTYYGLFAFLIGFPLAVCATAYIVNKRSNHIDLHETENVTNIDFFKHSHQEEEEEKFKKVS